MGRSRPLGLRCAQSALPTRHGRAHPATVLGSHHRDRRTSDGESVRLQAVPIGAGRARAGRPLPGPRQRPEGRHRHPLHRPRARPSAAPASTRTPPRRRPSRTRSTSRAACRYKNALAGLDHGGGKAVIIGDPASRQDRGAAARLRPVRRVPRRPLRDRLRRRHLRRGHGRRRPRDPLDHRPLPGERRRRRLLGADRLRRLPGHARLRPAPVGRADRCAAAGSASPASARSATTWSEHLLEDGAEVVVTDVARRRRGPDARAATRRSRPSRDTDGPDRAPGSTSTPPARSAARSTTPRWPR